MNKFVNIWLIIFFMLSLPWVLAFDYGGTYELFGFKFPGEEFAYNQIIYICFAGLLLIFGTLKAVRRWMGMFIAKQKQRFIFSTPITKERKTRITIYGSLEIIILVLLASFYLNASHITFYAGAVLLLIAAEHLLHLIIGLGANLFRVGITKSAVVCNDRDVTVMYYSGLRKVSVQQQTLYFEYIKNLTLFIPTNAVPLNQWPKFKKVIHQQVDKEKVFFNQEFKDYPHGTRDVSTFEARTGAARPITDDLDSHFVK